MTHPSIVDATKLHGAKPHVLTEAPQWSTTSVMTGAIAGDSDGRVYYAYDEDSGEAGWTTLMDASPRLRKAYGYPTWCATTPATAQYGVLWDGLSAGMPSRAEAPGIDSISSVSYPHVVVSATAASTYLTLYVMLPATYTAWTSDGIRMSSLLEVTNSSSIKIEVMDPTTGTSFGAGAIASIRSNVTVTETVYSWLTISSTVLGSNYQAGDMIKVVITVTSSSGLTSAHIGALEFNWS